MCGEAEEEQLSESESLDVELDGDGSYDEEESGSEEIGSEYDEEYSDSEDSSNRGDIQDVTENGDNAENPPAANDRNIPDQEIDHDNSPAEERQYMAGPAADEIGGEDSQQQDAQQIPGHFQPQFGYHDALHGQPHYRIAHPHGLDPDHGYHHENAYPNPPNPILTAYQFHLLQQVHEYVHAHMNQNADIYLQLIQQGHVPLPAMQSHHFNWHEHANHHNHNLQAEPGPNHIIDFHPHDDFEYEIVDNVDEENEIAQIGEEGDEDLGYFEEIATNDH